LHRKLGILGKQINRCKEALSVLSATAGAGRAESGHRMSVAAYLDEVIREWRIQRPDARLASRIETGPDHDIIAERSLSQALINVLNNAADASPEDVSIDARWTTTTLSLEISDSGPGLSADIHEQLGRTPVTTKTGGLGVGLFLAHATLQRLGGSLAIENRDQGGTMVRITIPLFTDKE
jgi:two-component system sensor histidine kinase RegB